jgi:hypothetical protein
MTEDGFDARTLANMYVALERVCQRRPDGEEHRLRKLVARRILQCAKSGKRTLGSLTEAGERVLSKRSQYHFLPGAPKPGR